MGKELFLDTKGLCFLCLEEGANDESGGQQLSEVCVRKICRFLNINPCLLILKCLKNRPLTEEEKEDVLLNGDKCDLSVALCGACASLTNNLSDIIWQLEMIKMVLGHELQEFHNMLSVCENNGEYRCQWNRLQEELRTSRNPLEGQLLEELRKEATENCSSKLKQLQHSTQPKVRLFKLKVEPERRSLKSPLFLSPSSSSSLSSHESDGNLISEPVGINPAYTGPNLDTTSQPELPQDFCETPALRLPSPATTPFPVFPEEAEDNVPNGTPSSFKDHHSDELTIYNQKQNILKLCASFFSRTHYFPNNLQCSLCNNAFDRTSIASHIAQVHPDKLFSSTKLSNVSESAFRTCCRTALEAEAKEGREQLNRSFPPPHKYTDLYCQYCTQKFDGRVHFKAHLVLEHYFVLEKKIKDLQDNLNPRPEPAANMAIQTQSSNETIPSNTGMAPKNSTARQQKILQNICATAFTKVQGNNDLRNECSTCKKIFPRDIKSLVSHLAYIHPERLFDNKKLPHVSEDAYKLYCKMALNTVRNDSRNAVKSITLSSEPNKGNWDVCVHCANGTSNYKCPRSKFVYHLVLHHYNILEEMLMRLQNDHDVTLNNDNCNSTTISSKGDSRFLCDILNGGCGRNFKSDFTLTIHKRGYCLSNKTRQVWTCNRERGGCGKQFKALISLRRHLRQSKCSNFEVPLVKTEVVRNCLSNPIVLQGFFKHSEKLRANVYRCVICNYTMKVSCQRGIIYRHLVSKHPEIFFNHKRLANCDEKVFGGYCKKMMTDKSNRGNADNEPRTTSCAFCDWKCGERYRKDERLSYHLITMHHDILEKKIVKMQEDEQYSPNKINESEMSAEETGSWDTTGDESRSTFRNAGLLKKVKREGLNRRKNRNCSSKKIKDTSKALFRHWGLTKRQPSPSFEEENFDGKEDAVLGGANNGGHFGTKIDVGRRKQRFHILKHHPTVTWEEDVSMKVDTAE